MSKTTDIASLPTEEGDVDISFFLENPRTAPRAKTWRGLRKQGLISAERYHEELVRLAMSFEPDKARDQTTPLDENARIQHNTVEAQTSSEDILICECMNMEDADKQAIREIRATADPIEGLQDRLEAAIEASQVTPVMAASAVILLGLSGPELKELKANERIALWFDMFFEEPKATRLFRYNVHVARAMGAQMRTWRKILQEVNEPLLPQTPRLARFTRVMMETAQAAVMTKKAEFEGGAGYTRKIKSPFRNAKDDKCDPLEGGAAYAQIVGTDGSTIGAMDLSSWEEFAATLHAKLDTLNANDRELASRMLNERPRTQTRQTNQKSYQGRNYSNGGRRGGYGNGSAGGKGHTYRGGEPQENSKN